MLKVIKFLSRLTENDAWFIALPRIILLLCWGAFILFRPAAGLRVTAWAVIPLCCAALLPAAEMLPPRYRALCFALPLLLILAILLPAHYDMAGLWSASLAACLAARRSWNGKTLLFRGTAVCAALAGFVLFCKSFTGDWFDLSPAAALVLFGAAALETGALKSSR
jgi:hypothetical protein